MKGDVGMSGHENEREQEDASLYTSLFNPFYEGIWISVCIVLFCIYSLQGNGFEQNKDVGMGL